MAVRSCIITSVIGLLLAAGCGGEDPPTVSTGTGEQRYTATTMVLDAPGRGPELCVGGIAQSLPPQCGGPALIGWDWDAVEGEESAAGTTWGEYTVVGTWDGDALTLTEPPTAARLDKRPVDEVVWAERFSTPCPPPEGGWQVVNPSTATQDALDAATRYASEQDGFGAVWLDQSANPAAANRSPDSLAEELAMNDPTKLVLNVSFTGDIDAHETAIRELWGGALCVSVAPKSAADLEELREEITGDVDTTFSSIDAIRGGVDIGVVIDDGLQAELDRRYGEGTVQVDPVLRPVDD